MVIVFSDDDKGYKDWVSANPRGFVLNAPRPIATNQLMLHSASCKAIQGVPPDGGTWTCGQYLKVCSDDQSELKKWVDSLFLLPLDLCVACFPKVN